MKTGQLSFTPELGHTEGVTWVSWCFVTGVVWSERDQRLLGLRPRWWLRALGKRRSQEIQEPCDVDRISTPSSPWPTVYPWDVIYLYPLSSTPQSRWLWDLDSGSAYWVDPHLPKSKAHKSGEQFEWDPTQETFSPESGTYHSLRDHNVLLESDKGTDPFPRKMHVHIITCILYEGSQML